jgi:hypothetical protein
LNFGLLVHNLFLDLVDLVVDGHQGLFSQLHLVLSLGFGGIVVPSPSSQFFVHGIYVIIHKLDRFSQGSGVLADALNHRLYQL